MRMWHKDLIEVLPNKQLVSQWRECCCIAKNMAEKGGPNHILVNRLIEYDETSFLYYTNKVINEIEKRGFKVSKKSSDEFYKNLCKASNNGVFRKINPWYTLDEECEDPCKNLYESWHNYRYLIQCFHNLQEKYDCGAIPEDQWSKVLVKFDHLMIQEMEYLMIQEMENEGVRQ